MKTRREIQRAHDLLTGIILGEAPNPFEENPQAIETLQEWASVLCWVLGHDHNLHFPQNLEQIEKELRARGVELAEGEEGLSDE